MAKSEAILDAGPLIHLAEIDALDVLRDFANLYVSNAIWEEVSRYQPNALEDSQLNINRIEAPEPSIDLSLLTQALTLDKGEIEALALLELHPQGIFLTDDTAARLAAIERGYTTHGTIGLLIRSARQGLRTSNDVLAILKEIPRKSTLHIRSKFLEDIIQQLNIGWFNKT